MGPLWTPWLVLLSAVPAIEVDDPVACVDAAAMTAALERDLPQDPALAALKLRVQVVPLPARTDQAAPLQLSLSVRDQQGRNVTQRSVEVARGDCAQLPRLISSIVGRQLEALPRQAWSAPMRRPVQAEAAGPRTLARPGRLAEIEAEAIPAWDLRLDLAWGFGLGIDRRSVNEPSSLRLGTAVINTHLSGTAALGSGGWPRLLLGLRGAAAQQAVGEGSVQIFGVRGLLGLTRDFRLGGLVLAPQLLLAGGLRLASGIDFDRNYVVALPAAALQANLALYSGRVLSAALGLEIPIVRMELQQRRGGDAYLEPPIRAHATIGFSWDTKI